MQPKESPEIEFMIKALTVLKAKCLVLEKNLLNCCPNVTSVSIENESQKLFLEISDAERDQYISLLNVERLLP